LGPTGARVDLAGWAGRAAGLWPETARERWLRRAEWAGRLIHLLVGAADIPGLVVLLWRTVACRGHIGCIGLLIVLIRAVTVPSPASGVCHWRLKSALRRIRSGRLVLALRLGGIGHLGSSAAVAAAAAAAPACRRSITLCGRLSGTLCRGVLLAL